MSVKDTQRRKYAKVLGLVEASARDARQALKRDDFETARQELGYLKAHGEILDRLESDLVKVEMVEEA